MKKNLFIFLFVLLALTNCKKDRLTGDAKLLSGRWSWVKTEDKFAIQTPANTGNKKTLEFKEKGKYEVEQNCMRLEGGRISYSEETNWSGNYFKIEFLRNAISSKKREFPNESIVRVFGNDSLHITQNVFDAPYHIYVREK